MGRWTGGGFPDAGPTDVLAVGDPALFAAASAILSGQDA